MPPKNEVDLDPQEQAILREWRLLVTEHYLEDIQHLEGNPDIIHGFEVEHAVLAQYDTLRTEFHLRPTRVLQLGTRIMREQFDEHMARMRPVIRVVGLDEMYRRRIDSLRMRDRNKVVSLVVKINHVFPPYGWVKLAVYECRDCGDGFEIPQRRARERESPVRCETCLAAFLKRLESGDESVSYRPPRPNFEMSTEHSKYEDVQDMNVCQVVVNDELQVLHTSLKDDLIATVSDDLVGELEVGAFARLNGIVRVQPFPNRTFSKDTRRVLSLDVLSIEPIDVGEA